MSKENRKFIGYFVDKNDNPTDETFIGWKARNMAVTIIMADIFTRKVLLERRGPGCPDNIGKLCCPCGYLNWDETLAEAAAREAYEETGFKIDISKVKMLYINDNPKSHLQNVTVRFFGSVTDDEIDYALKNNIINTDTQSRGGEANEVSEFLWVNIDDVMENYNPDDFAFNHYEMIKDTFKTL